MQLEIVDYFGNRVHLGSNGFVIVIGFGLIVSALKTDDGLYVAEKDIRNGELSLVRTFQTELEIMACIATWLKPENLDVLKGLRFNGLSRVTRGLDTPPISLKALTKRFLNQSDDFHSYLDSDMEAFNKMIASMSEGIPNHVGTIRGRMYADRKPLMPPIQTIFGRRRNSPEQKGTKGKQLNQSVNAIIQGMSPDVHY